MHDVFICHASEDKEDFVRPLAELLRQQHIDVWYDEFSLSVGDSLSQKIDAGLAQSKFGIVVLSPNFFKKSWPKRELTGLTAREMIEGQDMILPILHRITIEEVAKYSPPLADKKALSSADGINAILRDLTKKIRPEESPLIVARDFLTKLKVDTPPISDEWWLDIIEYKEFLKFLDTNAGKRWIFPLPYLEENRGRERGLNIASTALQIDWSFEGEELNISPLTSPDQVHEFLRRWPGLMECARENAGILALYAPQLTIPGFDDGLEDVFDDLLKPENKKADIIFSYGRHYTIDDKEPLCGDVISLRHPTFGNYTSCELAHWYFDAHDSNYIRSHWDIIDGLVWLLSDQSNWLPEKYKAMFIEGIRARDLWLRRNISDNLIMSFHNKTRKQFKITNTFKKDLAELTEKSIQELGIHESSDEIVRRILDIDIISGYYDYQEWIQKMRSRKNKQKETPHCILTPTDYLRLNTSK